MTTVDPARPAGQPESDAFVGQSLLDIEVAYATPGRQRIVKLQVARGTTVAQAIEASGLEREFPEVRNRPAVGIFSRKVTEHEELKEGDRVEIYRPLLIDPKEARRRKANEERKKSRGP